MQKSKQDLNNQAISHGLGKDYDAQLAQIKKRIISDGDTQDSSATERFELLDQLSQFNFGQYLILNSGVNGFWSRYIVLHPQDGRITGLNSENKSFSQLESWLLDRCPFFIATQERFFNFQRLTQAKLKEGVRLLSAPCGLMDDLLGLNYYGLNDYSLTGIDIDQDSVDYAKENAKQNGFEKSCEFVTQSAWAMDDKERYDVITSNGLNIYEPDDAKVVELYTKFHSALNTGGQLISSVITPPSSGRDGWDKSQINSEDLRLQKVIFAEILKIRWQEAYRTEKQNTALLNKAGFKDIRYIYDRQNIYPTFVANK